MRTALLACFTVLGAGCGMDVEPGGTGSDPTAQTTWYQDVAPILSNHCMGCHQPGGIGPFSLTTYQDAAPIANMLTQAIDDGIMPPFSETTANPDCLPSHGWKQDPRLTTTERATLQAWIDDGGPVGEPVDVPIAAPPDLPNKTHSLTFNPYVTAGTTDQFICFVLDPQTTTDTWLTGWQVRPGNATVVHHAVIMTLPRDLVAEAKTTVGIGNAFDCTAAAGVQGSQIIGAWAPGGNPFDMTDVGMKMNAGDGFVVQIHYHPAGQTATDATSFDLRLTATQPAHEYFLKGYGNAHGAPFLQPGPDDPPSGPKFLIPANVAGHTETEIFTQPAGLNPMSVLAAFPHMHFVGTNLAIKVTHASDNTQECLTNVDHWNFDWQRQYAVDAPIEQLPVIYPGDSVEIKCTYDNTLENPFVLRALHDAGLQAPVDVTLGEQTTNEMCLTLFAMVTVH